VSFEIRPTEKFWRAFHELSIPAQEAILDTLEGMRDHPGAFIDRHLSLPIRAACTRVAHVDTGGHFTWFSIVFQYDADELTIHVDDLLIVTDPI
jgi:hypothetical protein